ncbi:MAG: cobalamin B12-binding domain-containing protein, partial [Defluviitaleaceae bacterium]|nr:cobalamin B12-binding domain-containing protein [Defluviitaleaceae bacterium]
MYNTVVILAVNAKYVHSSLSAWVLARSVRLHAARSYDVHVEECTVNQADADIVRRVADHAPDVVAVSVYIWNAGKLAGLLEALRGALPGAVVVLGGPEASHNAEYWLDNGADYVVRGEGERAFPALLDCAENGGMPRIFETDAPFAPVDPYDEACLSA